MYDRADFVKEPRSNFSYVSTQESTPLQEMDFAFLVR
jgi:hypothetical protein